MSFSQRLILRYLTDHVSYFWCNSALREYNKLPNADDLRTALGRHWRALRGSSEHILQAGFQSSTVLKQTGMEACRKAASRKQCVRESNTVGEEPQGSHKCSGQRSNRSVLSENTAQLHPSRPSLPQLSSQLLSGLLLLLHSSPVANTTLCHPFSSP